MRRFASLRGKGDFARLRSRGRRVVTDHLTIFRQDATAADTCPVVGISVPKSVGTAIVRNRVRRRLTGCLEEHLQESDRLRLLIMARPSAAVAAYQTLCDQLRRALA